MTIQERVLLSPYTSYKIGGPARYFTVVKTTDELREAIQAARARRKDPFFLAGGTNLVVPDEGLDRFVIKLELEGFSFSGNAVRALSGTDLQELVDACVERSLGGLEWAGGLPGTIGGAVRGNAGAFGGETKDVVASVEALTETGEATVYSGDACRFGYRDSIFKHNADAIVAVTFQLHRSETQKIEAIVEDHRAWRRQKHPLEYPNAGSVFKNVSLDRVPESFRKAWEAKIKLDPFPVMPTAVIVAAAGLKGYRVGGAEVSQKHSNYIVNVDRATAKDVRAVIAHVKETVKDTWGIELEEEILLL